MYNVLDVARYIINYCNEKGINISHLKLQKILYFVQAKFLISGHDKGCFIEDIEAWDFGPVVRAVYNEFRSYGSSSIPKVEQYIDFKEGIWNAKTIDFDENIIADEDKELINDMVDKCSEHTASYLVEVTHAQDPWRDTFKDGEGRNNIILREAIKKYFK